MSNVQSVIYDLVLSLICSRKSGVKLAQYGTDGRLLLTANLEVT